MGSRHHDFSHAKKKPCLDDRDANSPLDKDRDTILPGPEERSSEDLAKSRRTKRVHYVVFVFNFIFITF